MSPEKNPDSDIPVSRGQTMYGLYSYRVIEDGSYLRLKTLSLAYVLPGRWLALAKISNMLWPFPRKTSGPGAAIPVWIPEVSVRHSALSSGFDYSAYPRGPHGHFRYKSNLLTCKYNGYATHLFIHVRHCDIQGNRLQKIPEHQA